MPALNDPVMRLAQRATKLKLVKLSADLEVQLSEKTGSAPAIQILRLLYERAGDSLCALAFCDPHDWKKVQTLQNEVKRYDEWVTWMGEIINEGIAIDKEISEEDRQEFLDVLVATSEGQKTAIELGLVDQIPRDE